MRWLITTVTLAMSMLACQGTASDSPVESGDVVLLTGVQACYAGAQSPSNRGLLVPDPEFGTRFEGKGPVMWPVGYVGRHVEGGQVAVFTSSGGLVATTGKEYSYSPVPDQGGEAGEIISRVGAVPVCDSYPWDFVDCATVADGTGDPAERPYCVFPPSYDLDAVKAAITGECEDPSVLTPATCKRLVVEDIRGEEGYIFIWATGVHRDKAGAALVCEEIAAAHDDLGGAPLGYETVVIEGKNNKRLAECTVGG